MTEQNIRDKGHRIGHNIYPLRVVGYWLAIATIVIEQINVLGTINTSAWVMSSIFLVYPHIAFFIYLKTGAQRHNEFRILLVDMFLIGCISNLVLLQPALALSFFIANSATNYSVKGFQLFWQGILSYLLGLGVSWWLLQPSAINDNTSLAFIPAFIYLFAGCHYIAILSHTRGDKIMKANAVLKEKNQEISEKSEEINQQKEELSSTLELVQQQNAEIEKKNFDITSSINYAKQIQQAMLPEKAKFNHIFGEENYFVFYRPRNIVSGDFYFLTQHSRRTIMAVADCTGHGVPGSLMSMIGQQMLSNVVRNYSHATPAEWLAQLHKGIRITLKQNENTNRDGMDIAIVEIDRQHKRITFAGAKHELLHIRDTKLNEIRGDRKGIGGLQREEERVFTNHTIEFEPTDRFYMFSDGIIHQFGGALGVKFSIQRLKSILLDISEVSLKEQSSIIEAEIDAWSRAASQNQTDDMLMVAFSCHHL